MGVRKGDGSSNFVPDRFLNSGLAAEICMNRIYPRTFECTSLGQDVNIVEYGFDNLIIKFHNPILEQYRVCWGSLPSPLGAVSLDIFYRRRYSALCALLFISTPGNVGASFVFAEKTAKHFENLYVKTKSDTLHTFCFMRELNLHSA